MLPQSRLRLLLRGPRAPARVAVSLARAQTLAQGLRPLSPQSESRDLALSSQMQEALEAKEREAQQLAEGQREVSVLPGRL